MQSEAVSRVINWGLGDFQKCKIRLLISKNVLPYRDHASIIDGLVEYTIGEDITLSQSSTFAVGLEIFRDKTHTGSNFINDFIDSIEYHNDYLTLNIELKDSNGEIISIESSKIQKLDVNGMLYNVPIFKKTSDGLLVYKNTSLQTRDNASESKYTLAVSLAIEVPPSKIPSTYRSSMTVEEQEIKAYLEGGRYRPPKVSPRVIEIPIKIIDSLRISCWSRPINTLSSFLCIELKNLHPWHDVTIRDVDIHLSRTLKISTKNSYESLYQCMPTVDTWFNLEKITNNDARNECKADINIRCGETYCVVYRVIPKSVVNNVGVNIISPNSKITMPANANTTSLVALSYSSLIPYQLSGAFVTPIDIMWNETSKSSFIDERTPTSVTEEQTTNYPFSNPSVICTSTSLRWEMIERTQNDVAIEIEGPAFGKIFEPTQLLIHISNCTPVERNLILYLECPVTDAKIYGKSHNNYLESTEMFCHNTSIEARNLLPGKLHSFNVTVIPLQATGTVKFKYIHLVDLETGEEFHVTSDYELAVRSSSDNIHTTTNS